MINNLGLSLIGMVGAALYLLGGVGMEQISSFVLYSRKFCGPINEIANIINEIYSALAAAERVFTRWIRRRSWRTRPMRRCSRRWRGMWRRVT